MSKDLLSLRLDPELLVWLHAEARRRSWTLSHAAAHALELGLYQMAKPFVTPITYKPARKKLRK